MGFVDSLRDVMRTFSGEDDYDDAPVSGARNDIYATASTASTAPDYSSYYHAPAQPQEPVQRPTVVPDAAVSTIAMLRATKLESVRAAADHLLENHAVIISGNQAGIGSRRCRSSAGKPCCDYQCKGYGYCPCQTLARLPRRHCIYAGWENQPYCPLYLSSDPKGCSVGFRF